MLHSYLKLSPENKEDSQRLLPMTSLKFFTNEDVWAYLDLHHSKFSHSVLSTCKRRELGLPFRFALQHHYNVICFPFPYRLAYHILFPDLMFTLLILQYLFQNNSEVLRACILFLNALSYFNMPLIHVHLPFLHTVPQNPYHHFYFRN